MSQLESSLLESLASLTPAERESALQATAQASDLTREELEAALAHDWRVGGRPKQHAPDWAWTFWLILAGRGFGKTLTGAQWVKKKGLENPGCRVALVAPTFADGRDTMVEGVTGLLAVLEPHQLRGGDRSRAWNRSVGELVFANGTICKIFSSEKADRARGPQHHFAWCEEVASWRDAHKGDVLETTWSNIKLATRLGANPQICLTTTPKPNKLVKALLAIPGRRLAKVTGSSYENRENLSDAWWEEVVAPYEGTRTGRQEIHAEVLEDVEGALWTARLLDELRLEPEDLDRALLSHIGVGVDPNASSDEAANAAGIIVAGTRTDAGEQHGYVLADRTVVRGGPRAWESAAVKAYYDYEADFIVAEKNNGGDMVKIMIQTVDPTVPVKLVWAARAKRTRAEPVSSLYGTFDEDGDTLEQGRVHHVGSFPLLEGEMTTWTPESESPDRMDALVWILSELMLKRQPGEGSTSVADGRIPGVEVRSPGMGVAGGMQPSWRRA